jgi:CheY-like chemotaxis protein
MKKIKKILVIEDDVILLKALNIELLSNGFDVVSAVNGEGGLELIKKGGIDLVLLDLIMPKLDGFKVLEVISQDAKLSKVPVIVLSNLNQKSDIERAKNLGAIDFYEKATTNLDVLVSKIKKI